MAVEWKCEHKRGSEYLFYPEEIVIKPENNGLSTETSSTRN